MVDEVGGKIESGDAEGDVGEKLVMARFRQEGRQHQLAELVHGGGGGNEEENAEQKGGGIADMWVDGHGVGEGGGVGV